MLRINVENVGPEIHLKLEGKLTGAWVTELEHCWHSCSEEFPGKAQVVDLAGTGFVDLAGKYLLTLMHQNGVRLIARSPWMNELVEEIAHSGAGKRSGS